MKIFKYIFILLLIAGCNQNNNKIFEDISLSNLRCEMLYNPLGIDIRQPRLSWIIQSNDFNIKQKYYHILVASSKEKLDQNIGDLWDSGKKSSSNSTGVKYKGQDLKSNFKYFWKVKVWTENGESKWSEPASWSMGYFYYKDWKGRWIGLDRSFPWDDESMFSRLSARYFRKEINTNSKQINNATVHIIGLGLYELYINGKKTGDHVLTPAPTDFTRNVKYNTYDVTGQIKNGKNAIGIILGNGRYYTMRQNYKPYKIKTFGYPKLLLNLIIVYNDGTSEIFRTDNTWKVTANGPIRTNNEYDGEEYDARKEMPGWCNVGYNDNKWLQAEYVQEPQGEFEAQMNEKIKVKQVIKPISIQKIKNKKYILDMGQNMAGWLRIKVKGRKGNKIILRFAESLKEDGEIFTANLRDAKATDIYFLKGSEEEIWEPRFVYHGFRFVEITGFPGEPDLNNFEGCVVYDDIPEAGSFETSNPLINQIYKNALWSINASYKGMPTDCPQRNERMPWLGDRAIGCYGESFVFDNSRLYVKWLDDIMYSQKSDGCISDVAPPYFRYYSDNMTWPGTYILVAQMLYQQYDLTDPIKKHYPYMKKWLFYMKERYMKNYILTKDSYGDWCNPPKTIEEGRGKSADVKRPSKLISTAYFYHYLKIMEDFAKISNKSKDIKDYKKLSDSVKLAFNKTFFNPDSSFYGNNTLTDNILPVYFKLVPDDSKDKVLNTIYDIIINKNDTHLSSGLVGVQWLMRTLTENGMQDVAYKLATNITYPSWGYMVENGATTIWELWNANTAAPQMNSQNHVMLLGDLIIWFYENLAGIKSSTSNTGFKEIIMNPSFIDQLDYVRASYHSVYGMITSNWSKQNDTITWKVNIPSNSKALIYFPENCKNKINVNGDPIKENKYIKLSKVKNQKVIYKVVSGNYEFTFKN